MSAAPRNDSHHHLQPSQSSRLPLDPCPYTLLPSDTTAFITLVADSLRLRTETLAMAFLYTNRYRQYLRDDSSDGSDDPLDDHTLALASLSLATKATESPRRLREFILPSYNLMNPSASSLRFPSALYDSLRSTVVTAELLLLRILKFDIRLPLPFDFLPRFLNKTLELDGTDHLDYLHAEEKEESCVVDVRETSLGKAVWTLVLEAMKSYRLAILFPPRTVAAACFYTCIEARGMGIPVTRELWLRKLTGDKVEYEDFTEAVQEIKYLQFAG